MKIGIIVGSVRDEQMGASVGEWVLRHAQAKGGAEFELVSLKDFDLPVFSSATLPAMADKSYDSEQVQAWSRVIDDPDGYIFVTPEYNHSVPGPLKNAIDFVGSEFRNKPIAFASYGADKGVRAVENWRVAFATFGAATVRDVAAFSLFTDFTDGKFTPQDVSTGPFQPLLKTLLAWADAFQEVRKKLG